MTYQIDQLPNPHLAEFLAETFTLSPAAQGILAAQRNAAGCDWRHLGPAERAELLELRRAHLQACRLPGDYDELNPSDQQMARYATLSAWYDRKQPNVLVTDLEGLVAAVYLWVEEYIKPAERNRGTYYHRDPRHKYRMVRTAFGPPKIASEPTKTLITAPRGSTKTRTLIGQVVPMMVTCRPHTEALISEINEDRTGEELAKVQIEFEENEFIQHDFGGKGGLFPSTSRGSRKWCSSRLDLIHQPGCSIIGQSWNSKQRGRHPILRIIDDPEDPQRPMDAEERKLFWVNLFRRDMPMLTKGNVFLWISTLILGGCCHQAMLGALEEDQELQNELADVRFDDWNLVNFDLLMDKPDGTVESIYPDYINADEYAKKEQAIGKRDAMAEYRGIATAAGQFVFQREQFKHHYMHCVRTLGGGGSEEYMFDLVSGEMVPWDKFLGSLFVGQATDIADGTSRDSDYGAIAVVGVDHKQWPTFYVLDMFLGHVISERLVAQAFRMAGQWRCERSGWETGSMQNVVVRYAERMARDLQKHGLPVPKLSGMVNHRQQKVQRIIATLLNLYSARRIRFPWFSPVHGPDGTLHTPVVHPSQAHFKILYSQLDYFTDEGASGADDGPDALQMAVRLLSGHRGMEVQETDRNAEEIRKWAEAGVHFSPAAIDIRSWTPEMLGQMGAVPELNDMEIYD